MFANQAEEYFSGVLDVYYAVMTGEDKRGAQAAPGYDQFETLGKTIDVNIVPSYKEGRVYASNAMQRNQRKVDYYTVTLNMDKIPYDVRQKLLGRTVDANGVQFIGGDDIAPNVAIAFEITMDGGNSELWVMYKGTFAEPTQAAHTDADTITYQHPTIEGRFVRREFDNKISAVVATDGPNVTSTVKDNWFTQVYEAA